MPPTLDDFSTDSEEEEYTLDEALESILGDAALIMIYPSAMVGDEEGYGIPDELLITYWTRLHGEKEQMKLHPTDVRALMSLPQFTTFPGVSANCEKAFNGALDVSQCTTVLLNEEHISAFVLNHGDPKNACSRKAIAEGWAVLQVYGSGVPTGKGTVNFIDSRNSKNLGYVPLHAAFRPTSSREENWEVYDTRENDGYITFVNEKFADEIYEDSEIPREPSKNPAKPATPTGPTGAH